MNCRIKTQLIADAGAVIARHPSLAIVWKEECPVKIIGNYIVRDDEGSPQGDFDIEVRMPAGYPYAFPQLKEISTKIRREDDWHMGANGIACVENPRRIALLQRQGISLAGFFDRYVHPYFCWQLVAGIEGVTMLPGWAHGVTGIMQFYKETCGTDDECLIRKMLAHIVGRNLPGRNDACFCGSGKKYKRCHHDRVGTILTLGFLTLKNDLTMFDIARERLDTRREATETGNVQDSPECS